MLRSATLVALVGACAVLAAKCSDKQQCPETAPCCSQYGECGTGAFCLGGCEPRMSFSLDSCVPAPVCKSTTSKFTSLDSVVDIGKYLGDSTRADWVSQGEVAIHRDNLLLTMPRKSAGTVLASTSYMWYGTVKARLKSSRGRGVVTAFILLSDVKDEVDFEFVGADLDVAQTNYYFQGELDYRNAGNISASDTFGSFHEYEIRWTPEHIEWYVDGNLGRRKLRKDTWNEEQQRWDFPQTPARVQLSIWPGGQASNEKGTIDWAGGEIDWNAPDVQKAGYYYATVSEVSIECYDAKTGPGTNSGKSYTYSNARGTNDTVVDGDKDTVLGSLEATGLDMDKGNREQESSTEGAAKPKKTQQNPIPGGSSGWQGHDGGHENKGGRGAGSSGSGGGGGGGRGDTGSSQGGGSSGCDTKTFRQSCDGDGKNGDGKSGSGKVGASALAMMIAGGALVWL
ncbi:cell wall glucanase (Utr2) [Ophiocordyceps sinensis CO18]|uniref:Cell wall glucanase (Utr2) n=1 Tax=Ophiocordyceps sinensis (strain Co18 / CGMCC 3.14243) TaxID=911162 RepID=T5A915_OPHSC|nr:cell wall glucanase (Utr2) [Ophiocordyceps sinensis CO18]